MNANVVYLIIVMILTWIYFQTRSLKSNEDEYFVLNKSEGVLGLSLSFYASGMGLWILTSPAEVAWYGLGYDIYGYALSAATPFLLIYIFGPKIAELLPNGATLAQFVETKYGIIAQKIVSIVAVIYMGAFLIAEFASISFVFESISSVRGVLVSLLIAITTLAYLFRHGFKASYFTDRIQSYGIIFLLAIVLMIWFSQNSFSDIIFLANSGGLNSFETFSLKSALAVIIAVTAAEVFSMGYWQRTFSAENSKVIKQASIYSGTGAFLTILILGIGGAVGAGKGLEVPALSFIDQLELNNFTIMLLISLATLLVTSSIDTLENAIASTISLDIIKKKSEEAKLITLLVVGIALIISNEVTSIFNVFLVADLFAACLVFPAFYRIKKSSKDILLVVPFVGSLISAYIYRYVSIDPQLNPGGVFVPTDLYGLADLNTFAVALLSSMVITVVADKVIKYN
jgi:SSS family solute:Na+ symporter